MAAREMKKTKISRGKKFIKHPQFKSHSICPKTAEGIKTGKLQKFGVCLGEAENNLAMASRSRVICIYVRASASVCVCQDGSHFEQSVGVTGATLVV